MSDGWIGVDFDGTLAMHIENKPYDPAKLGEPVPAMLERVKAWLAEGKDVRIFTARVSPRYREMDRDVATAAIAIQRWCITHLGTQMRLTCIKDPDMLELWDDRAVQVIRNSGVTVGEWANTESSLQAGVIRKQRDHIEAQQATVELQAARIQALVAEVAELKDEINVLGTTG